MSRFHNLALAFAAVASLAASASADSLVRPGSLLLFPHFDNYEVNFTLTVTNTNPNVAPVSSTPGALLAGTVDVEFVYIEGYTCLEFNRTHRLTPNDTLTVVSRLHNPSGGMGYVYAFAKSPTTGRAIKWDWLIGDSFNISPIPGNSYGIAPVVFKAGSGLAEGAPTDVDNDFVRDLDGTEYERVSDKLMIPRFVAHDPSVSRPELILVGLSGGSFTTTVNFLIYNDNEEVFSAQYDFTCWARVELASINGAFTNQFLMSTANNPLEYLTPTYGKCSKRQNMLQSWSLETGWYRMDASIANSSAASILNPAFMAVQVEHVISSGSSAATLPYGLGEQSNGDLVPFGPFPN